MFKDLRKKLSTPENLTIIFYGATLFVILARLIDLIIKINSTKPITPWASWEYTIAFLLPLGGFAYFCSSKFAKNTALLEYHTWLAHYYPEKSLLHHYILLYLLLCNQ